MFLSDQTRQSLSMCKRVLKILLINFKWAVIRGFHVATLPWGPDWLSWLWWSCFHQVFPSLQRTFEAVLERDCSFLGHFPDQGPSLAWWQSLAKKLNLLQDESCWFKHFPYWRCRILSKRSTKNKHPLDTWYLINTCVCGCVFINYAAIFYIFYNQCVNVLIDTLIMYVCVIGVLLMVMNPNRIITQHWTSATSTTATTHLFLFTGINLLFNQSIYFPSGIGGHCKHSQKLKHNSVI